MRRVTSISLEDQFAEFVDRLIDQGRYESISEVVQAGLQLLSAREGKLDALRAALTEGEQSGPAEPFDVDEFLVSMHRSGNGPG